MRARFPIEALLTGLLVTACGSPPSLNGASGLTRSDYEERLGGTWDVYDKDPGPGKSASALQFVVTPEKNRSYGVYGNNQGRVVRLASFHIYALNGVAIVECTGSLVAAPILASCGLAVPTSTFLQLEAQGKPPSRLTLHPMRKSWLASRRKLANSVMVDDGTQVAALLRDAAKAPANAFEHGDKRVFAVRSSAAHDEDAKKKLLAKASGASTTSKSARDRAKPRSQRIARKRPAKPRGAKPSIETALPMVWIKPGAFLMGSPRDEVERKGGYDEHQHVVTLTQGFYMGKFEVTQREYSIVIGDNPSLSDNPKFPVESVSWRDAVAFCRTTTKRSRAAGKLPAGWEYRLPTEAEWEYACRAGSQRAFSTGSRLRKRQAHFGADKGPVAVGSYPANAWGLHDMHGNVDEWCLDNKRRYAGAATDPVGAAVEYRRKRGDKLFAGFSAYYQKDQRVTRGGCYILRSEHCRSANRATMKEQEKKHWTGFRVVLAPTRR